MKLPNGYGSVYKLSGKRRCPYRVVVTEQWQQDRETGKWKQKRKTIGYYETKAGALEALAEYNKSPFDLEASKSNSMKCMSVGAKNIIRQSQKVTLKDAKPHIYYASQ